MGYEGLPYSLTEAVPNSLHKWHIYFNYWERSYSIELNSMTKHSLNCSLTHIYLFKKIKFVFKAIKYPSNVSRERRGNFFKGWEILSLRSLSFPLADQGELRALGWIWPPANDCRSSPMTASLQISLNAV